MFIMWRHLPPLASTLWNHSTRSDVDCWWQSRRSGVAADSTGHVSSSVSHVYNTGQGDVVYYPNVTGGCFLILTSTVAVYFFDKLRGSLLSLHSDRDFVYLDNIWGCYYFDIIDKSSRLLLAFSSASIWIFYLLFPIIYTLKTIFSL